MKVNNYPECSECGIQMIPIWFLEEEYDGKYKTGRVRKAVDYFVCPCCLCHECIDDSFDGSWIYMNNKEGG